MEMPERQRGNCLEASQMSIEPAVMDTDPSTTANLPYPGIKVVANGNPLVAYYTEARVAKMAG